MRVTRRHSTALSLLVVLIAAVTALGPPTAPTTAEAAEGARVASGGGRAEPQRLDGEVAEVLVRVRGSSVCSGTPITGTRFVVTAAHCVLDSAGAVTTVTIVRDGVEHSPRAVLVNLRYHDSPSEELDAAVLITDRAIPGPSASLGDAVPAQGVLTLAGFQPIDTDGTLLRGTNYHDRPLPKGFTGGVVEIKSRPAGCVDRASSIEVSASRLKVQCGLIPGASGGGLFAEDDRTFTLHGIISTVGIGLSFNGVTPLSTVHDLLNHPGHYRHAIPEGHPVVPHQTINRT
jgi:hypothetical protein